MRIPDVYSMIEISMKNIDEHKIIFNRQNFDKVIRNNLINK